MCLPCYYLITLRNMVCDKQTIFTYYRKTALFSRFRAGFRRVMESLNMVCSRLIRCAA